MRVWGLPAIRSWEHPERTHIQRRGHRQHRSPFSRNRPWVKEEPTWIGHKKNPTKPGSLNQIYLLLNSLDLFETTKRNFLSLSAKRQRRNLARSGVGWFLDVLVTRSQVPPTPAGSEAKSHQTLSFGGGESKGGAGSQPSLLICSEFTPPPVPKMATARFENCAVRRVGRGVSCQRRNCGLLIQT